MQPQIAQMTQIAKPNKKRKTVVKPKRKAKRKTVVRAGRKAMRMMV